MFVVLCLQVFHLSVTPFSLLVLNRPITNEAQKVRVYKIVYSCLYICTNTGPILATCQTHFHASQLIPFKVIKRVLHCRYTCIHTPIHTPMYVCPVQAYRFPTFIASSFKYRQFYFCVDNMQSESFVEEKRTRCSSAITRQRLPLE